MNKIFCFGDGFAANHIWPEWPAMVSALYPDCDVENFGAIGAGNEFIASAVIDAHIKHPDAFFLIQWAMPNRFDKLIQDQTWDQIIDKDPVYHFNRVEQHNRTWWLSSASQQLEIQQYHKLYVQSAQACLRTFNLIYLIGKLLVNKTIFFSTYKLPFDTQQKIALDFVPWVDIDMHGFSNLEKFKSVRGSQIQPRPEIHFNFLKEHVLLLMPVFPDLSRLHILEQRICETVWEPYDPDREEIWKNISNFSIPVNS
jgi:hypothetical protein